MTTTVEYQHILTIPTHYDPKDPALMDRISDADLVLHGDYVIKDIHDKPRQIEDAGELAAIRRMEATQFVGTDGEKLERLLGHLEATIGGGAMTIRIEDGEWSTMAVFGREADDSPMAGAASHGVGNTLAQCLDMMLRETGA